ncbi:neutral zinc metallopeptidase [Allonocardiopsis opalescens]|uniref:Metalloprotease n=1 Tax=Allonocardiopsis opalescens TaxID=1144618 RepID=A0A2T0QA31_9ACTN|nr:neutral zinc metallopeptidase [Allonocardiopsis opalescens]PRY00756.1 hypothetical protein CLV72_102388 [Allonocardiopsis opalescens]
MAERSHGGGAPARARAADRYAPRPLPAQRRRGMDLGTAFALVLGVLAFALAGIVAVAALLTDSDQRTTAGPGRFGEPSGLATPEDGRPPGTRPSGQRALTDNPLYTAGPLPTSVCEPPELAIHDEASMTAFLHATTDCLDATWAAEFADTGMPFGAPERVFWTVPGRSPCGDYPLNGSAAFYCAANKGLYIGVDDVVHNSAGAEQPVVYGSLIGHEYAHHVQMEAGILGYMHDRRRRADGAAEAHTWTRRSELQANCLSGVFLGSVADSFPVGEEQRAAALADAYARGDGSASAERTHGTPENARDWLARGLAESDPGACDTWSAAEASVR